MLDGHPLIHLGYAYELSSRTVGVEALALAACCYSDLHKYLDDPSYTRPAKQEAKHPLDILLNISEDQCFDKLFDHPGPENVEHVLSQREDVILDYWNAWDLSEEPQAQFKKAQELAVALLAATQNSEGHDFFLLHILTTSHAVRILLPLVPARFEIPLIRQWWLLTLLTYVAQLRPRLDIDRINEYQLDGRTWEHVAHSALTSRYAHDAHYVKGRQVRARKSA